MIRSRLCLCTALLLLAAAPLAAAPAAEIPLGGRVVDSQGNAVSGASVELLRLPGKLAALRLALAGRAAPEPIATTSSDAEGHFRLAAPEAGMWTVAVRAHGFLPVEIDLLPLLSPIELPPATLSPAVSMIARVLDPQGRSVAGARIETRTGESGADDWRPAGRLAITAADGRATLPAAAGERLALVATAAGYGKAESPETARPALDLRLASGCGRTIEVRQERGQPAAGAVVSTDGVALGVTDATGRFALAAPCAREMALDLTAEDGQSARVVLRPVAPGHPAESPRATLRAPSGALAGSVVEAGSRKPLAAAFVWPQGDPAAFVRTDAKGAYSLPTREAPESAGGGSRPALWLSAAAARHLPAGEPAATGGREGKRSGPTLALTPVALASGAVVDEADKPVAGALVWAAEIARPWEGPFPDRASPGPRSVSDARGLFEIEVAPRERRLLVATRRGFTTALLPLAELPPEGRRSGLRIVLRQGRSAVGRVLDRNDRPVAGAEVTLEPAADGGRRSLQPSGGATAEAGLRTGSGADGRFTLEHLPNGRFDLRAKAPGFTPVTVRGLVVRAGPGPIDLGTVILPAGVDLLGLVVDPQGQPVAGAVIETRPYDTGSLGRSAPGFVDPGPVSSEEDGRFTIRGLAPGVVALAVGRQGYTSQAVSAVRAPSAEPVRIVLQPAARVTGRVVDERREPVSGAEVRLEKPPEDVTDDFVVELAGQAVTDAAGRFAIEATKAGRTELTASAPGRLPAGPIHLAIAAGQDAAAPDLILRPGATITGTVSLADGAVASGASVFLLPRSPGGLPPSDRSVVAATADGDGRYRLAGVAKGTWSVVASAPGAQRAVKDLEVETGESRLDFRLAAGFDVDGRVVDAAGGPVEGAEVELSGPGDDRGATSAADGAFHFGGAAPGLYYLRAGKEGFAGASLDALRLTDASLQGLELKLARGCALAGKLLGLSFPELAGVRVFAFGPPGSQDGQVDFQGGYRIEDLAAGRWTVEAQTADGIRGTRGEAVLVEGSEATLDLELSRGLTLSGHVVRAGEPVGGAAVKAWGEDEGEASTIVRTDREGAFRIESLPPGNLRIEVFDGETIHQEQLTLTESRDVVIDLPTTRLSGHAVDAADGSGLADVTVTLEGTDPARPGPPSRLPSTTSDATGAFTLSGIAPGAYRIAGQKEGYARGEVAVQVEDGTQADDLRLALQPARGLTLTVLRPSGTPPTEVEVALLDAAGRAVAAGTYPVGEGGSVRVPDAPEGTFRLLLTGEGSATLSRDVTVPGETLHLTLFPASTLIVTVPDLAAGETAATLTLADTDGRAFLTFAWPGVRQEWQLTSGTATVRSLPPGSWRLHVKAGDRVWQGQATTVAGGEVEVILK